MKQPESPFSRRHFLKRTGLVSGFFALCGVAAVPLPALAGWASSGSGSALDNGNVPGGQPAPDGPAARVDADDPADARSLADPRAQGGRTFRQTRLLMGTVVTLAALARSQAQADEAFADAFAEMERLIAVFDRHNAASALGVLNDQGRLAAAPPELLEVLRASERLGRETAFAFNPAVAPVLALYEAARAAAGGLAGPRPLSVDDKALAEALELARPGGIYLPESPRSAGSAAFTGSGLIRLEREGMRLTLDGIAKGYIADAASRRLRARNLPDHLINAGGDIRVSGLAEGGRPWRVGVQDPRHPEGVLEVVTAGDCAIATSGGYENYFDHSHSQHHIIDPRTGRSPGLASITVRAPDAGQADALATALALLPPALAIRYAEGRTNTACLIISGQGRRYSSANWAG